MDSRTFKALDGFRDRRLALVAGATDAIVTEHHGKGGEGAVDLGNALIKACETKPNFKFLYPVDIPIKVPLSNTRNHALWLVLQKLTEVTICRS